MSQPNPKQCAACGQPATVFVNYTAGGKILGAAWCETHATAAGLADSQGYALIEGNAPAGHRPDTSPRCAVCDCSQRDFERQGRFGCPACYTSFSGILTPLLNRMHRDTFHRGKIPGRGANAVMLRRRMTNLSTELNKAVRTEQFEEAAQTRDVIEALKAKILATDPPGGQQSPTPLPPIT